MKSRQEIGGLLTKQDYIKNRCSRTNSLTDGIADEKGEGESELSCNLGLEA